jgi:hypothetical protein
MSDNENETENIGEKLFHYYPKFGWIYQDSKIFDDKKFLNEYIHFRLKKIKIWYGNKGEKVIIGGIQTFYKNLVTGEFITSGENKGTEGIENVDEMEIDSNEFVIKQTIRFDTEIVQLGYETNKGKKILVGCDTVGEDMTSVLSDINNGENIIVTIHGNYRNCLEGIGCGYIIKKDYIMDLYIGYFQLRFKIKKNEEFKKQCQNLESTLIESDKALLKTAFVPDGVFQCIMGYCMC